MSHHDSAIRAGRGPVSGSFAALGWGLLGVLAFSFTVPFTHVATGGLDPLFVATGRAVVAAVLATAALVITRQPRPDRRQWLRVAVVGGGVVIGFPVLTSYALVAAPASHGAVVIALLPAVTATTVVLRTGERVPLAFWVVAAIGAVAAVGFALVERAGVGELHPSDLMLFGAVVTAAIGYAEGGVLSRELGSWQTVSWALVLCAPVMAATTAASVIRATPVASASQWAAFGYLAAVSMFVGFVAWYRGLAIGPMARISQVQLVQPVLSIAWAALLLGEPLTTGTVVGGAIVVVSAAVAVRVRIAGATPAAGSRPVASAGRGAG